MNRYLLPAVVIPVVLVLAGVGDGTAQEKKPQPDSDVADIKALVAKYAKTVETVDMKMAAEIWETDDKVSFIHPRGHEKGWEQVKKNFYEKTMGGNFTERKLTPGELDIRVTGDAAVVVFYWEFKAIKKKDGKVINTKGRETQVLHKTKDGWRLVHVHYSGPPVTGENEGF